MLPRKLLTEEEKAINMATSAEQNGKASCSSNVDLLLHPELLSLNYMQLILSEKNVSTKGCKSRDRLTDLYVRHVMPQPQRTLPDNRWGRRMEKSRGRQSAAGPRTESSSNDHSRKRPLIVFDGSSSQPAPLKVRKPEGSTMSPGIADRLKPPPTTNLSNPIRKLSTSSSASYSQSSHNTNAKREANSSDALKSQDVKKKIQHVTWP